MTKSAEDQLKQQLHEKLLLGQNLHAMEMLREKKGLSLREAKSVVDGMSSEFDYRMHLRRVRRGEISGEES